MKTITSDTFLNKLYTASIKNSTPQENSKKIETIEKIYQEILEQENLGDVNIHVEVDLFKTKRKPFNAYAKVLNDNVYEIVFCPDLVLLIEALSKELTNSYKEYFSVINVQKFYDKDKRKYYNKLFSNIL